MRANRAAMTIEVGSNRAMIDDHSLSSRRLLVHVVMRMMLVMILLMLMMKYWSYFA
jgi:hypothetical protein